MQHKIYTLDDIPINTRPYRFLLSKRKEVEKVIHKIKTEGAIRNLICNSPLLIIPKKIDATGKKKWRIVIDFWLLNEKTIGDAYPLPNISNILDHLGTAQCFSIFDFAKGFYQTELDPKDRQKTACSSLNGHYKYVRMPIRLKNSPATFQRLMDQVLLRLQGTELFVYLDDIVIYSR